MKIRSTVACMVLAVATMFVPLTSSRAAAQATWQQIPVPPLPAFHPPQPKRIELSNGMVIFLLEDHELPLIAASSRIRGGSSDEPADKIGLAGIFGEVWRTGGTSSQTGDQLDDFLEVRAAKVETGAGVDSTSIGLNCLKGDFDDVFKVFVELLLHPEFRADKLDLAQKQAYDGISRRNDDVGEIAARETAKLAYGADNPYALEPEYATIAAIHREDLLHWYQTYIQPNRMILGITGDFDSVEMEAKLRAALGSWPKGADLPDGGLSKKQIQYHPAQPGYYLIPKDDVNQSNINAVTLGILRSSPDFYAISVFNQAFGGGFSSRLFNDIRTKRGLAYEVGGGIGANFGHPGMEQFVIATKSQSTIESIKALDEDIDALATRPITGEEIEHAKDAILNAFIFRLDSPEKILAERMTYEFYGYPADWLDQFPAKIHAVTAADVNRVAAKYLHRDQLAVLVVGNTKDFDKPLSSLGPVKEIDIAIPPPPGAKESAKEEEAAKPTESNAEGKALAAKVVEAMGGAAKLAGVKAVKSKLTLTQKTPQGDFPFEVESVIVFPDHLHAEMEFSSGAMNIVVTPDLAFMAVPGQGMRDMPAAQKAETLDQIKRDPIFIAAHANDANVFFRAAGSEKVGAIETRIVDVNAAGAYIRWFVDPQSGHILKETYKTLAQGGPVEGETDFDNWKPMAGLTIPVTRHNKQNGQETSTAEYTSIEINPTVDPKLFEKPAEKPAAQP